jgi:hypothetical protein
VVPAPEPAPPAASPACPLPAAPPPCSAWPPDAGSLGASTEDEPPHATPSAANGTRFASNSARGKRRRKRASFMISTWMSEQVQLACQVFSRETPEIAASWALVAHVDPAFRIPTSVWGSEPPR